MTQRVIKNIASLSKSIKEKHSDIVVLFRTKDTYCAFGLDAVTLHKKLDLPLVQCGEEGVDSMLLKAEFKYYFLDDYLPKMFRRGFRIQIADYKL